MTNTKIWLGLAAASGLVALTADTNACKSTLYEIEAYTPSMQSKIEFTAEVALGVFLVAYVCSAMKKEEPPKKEKK